MGENLGGAIDYDSIWDLCLEVSDYQEKLEELLKTSRIRLVEKRKLIRQKVQEFKDAKRYDQRSKLEKKENKE